jgi:hypothetical protein
LREFFDARRQGPGIWKWTHYFDIYDRYFSPFRGRDVRVLEIGIYSGGSLDMWAQYFGSRAKIYGIDIEPSCKVYAGPQVEVHIGDQADRGFWQDFTSRVRDVDIVIDDGGHLTEQQVVTFEEMLPHMRSGGIYLCEDIHHEHNGFGSYMYGAARHLNGMHGLVESNSDPERRIVTRATPFQSAVRAVHFYPYVTVVERNDAPVEELVAPKHGTRWEPFLT